MGIFKRGVKRGIGAAEKSLFQKDGQYWERKDAWAKKQVEKKGHKKSNEFRKDCEVVLFDAWKRVEHLKGGKKSVLIDRAIKAVENRIKTSGVPLTKYDDESIKNTIEQLKKRR